MESANILCKQSERGGNNSPYWPSGPVCHRFLWIDPSDLYVAVECRSLYSLCVKHVLLRVCKYKNIFQLDLRYIGGLDLRYTGGLDLRYTGGLDLRYFNCLDLIYLRPGSEILRRSGSEIHRRSGSEILQLSGSDIPTAWI
ncbi:hypothetical protein BgiBS90_028508 [Biomphalaria glabrata]|nr:hypothetical protein BgiBS90_028508 [Biomphalaria glabrata]